MRELFSYVVKRTIDWFTRKKSPFIIVFSGSTTIVLALVGIGGLTGTFSVNDLSFQISDGDSFSDGALNFVLLSSVIIMILSVGGIAWERIGDIRASRGQKVFVIEGRGLRDDDGGALSKALGRDFPVSRVPYLLDLRQRLDGKIILPENLLPKFSAMREAVNQFRIGNGRESSQVVYGGLTAVPFTFLTGVELDDEGKISVLDWDRTIEAWRELDAIDDNKRFSVPDIGIEEIDDEILLTVSVSYPISQSDLDTTFDLKRFHMELEDGAFDSHWSNTKQNELATQLIEFVKILSGAGVKKIHLVLASPNSLTFNIGRRYDRRNLPDLTVYQYERSQDKMYPWGVKMPVGTVAHAQIEYT